MTDTFYERNHILIVSEDKELISRLSSSLEKEYFNASAAYGPGTMFNLISSFSPDLILIDAQLRDVNGTELCREIRKDHTIPIILLSTESDVLNKVLALEFGADDYLTKPFDNRELIARIRAVLRRSGTKKTSAPAASQQNPSDSSCKLIQYPGLSINLTNYSVQYLGHPVEMPPRELELLYFLASAPNQVFTREQLLDHVWGYEYIGDTRTVDVHIKRIRAKIKDYADWSIATVWGVGYKFQIR